MKISVIVPTRNRPAVLAQALHGVAAQTHADVELIVVDDGSEPAAAAQNARLVRAFPAGARLLALPAPQRPAAGGRGPGRVRNLGLEAASGDLVAFCDDDDDWRCPGWLARAEAAFRAEPELDLLFANQEAHASGQPVRRVWQPALQRRLAGRPRTEEGLVALTRADCLVEPGDFAHLNASVLRRTLVLEVGGFRPELSYAEDLDFHVRVVDRARSIRFLDRTVSRHHIPDRDRRDNASTRVDLEGRQAVLHTIARELVRTCATAEARTYARALGAQACRSLARHIAGSGRRAEASAWAWRAVAWQPSWRWRAYAAWLALRGLGAFPRRGVVPD